MTVPQVARRGRPGVFGVMLAMGVVLALLWSVCSSEEPGPPAQPAAALPAAPAPTPAAVEPVPPPTPLPAAPAAPSLSPILPSAPVALSPIPAEEVSDPAGMASFIRASCRFRAPSGQGVDCGYLRVPEDRSQPDGPTIRLHVAIFRTQSESSAPDPIVSSREVRARTRWSLWTLHSIASSHDS